MGILFVGEFKMWIGFLGKEEFCESRMFAEVKGDCMGSVEGEEE